MPHPPLSASASASASASHSPAHDLPTTAGRRASRRVSKRTLDADDFLALSLSPSPPSLKTVDGDKENRKVGKPVRASTSAPSKATTMKAKGKAKALPKSTTSTQKPLPDILLLGPPSVSVPSPSPSPPPPSPSPATKSLFPPPQHPTRKRRRTDSKEETTTVTHTRASKRLRGQNAPIPTSVPVVVGQSDESDVEESEPIEGALKMDKRNGRKRARGSESTSHSGGIGVDRSPPKSRTTATATKAKVTPRGRQRAAQSPPTPKPNRAARPSPPSPKATRSRAKARSSSSSFRDSSKASSATTPNKRMRTAASSSSSSSENYLATRTRSRTKIDIDIETNLRRSVEAESDASDETLVDPDAEDPVPLLLSDARCEMDENVAVGWTDETMRVDVDADADAVVAERVEEVERVPMLEQEQEGKKTILELLSNLARGLGPNPLIAVDSPSSILARTQSIPTHQKGKSFRALHAFPHPTQPQTEGKSKVAKALVELVREGLGTRIQEKRARGFLPRSQTQEKAKAVRTEGNKEDEMDIDGGVKEQLPETSQSTGRPSPLPIQTPSKPYTQAETQTQRSSYGECHENFGRHYEWDIYNFEFSFTPPSSPSLLPTVVPSSVPSLPASLPPTTTASCSWNWTRWMAREPSRLRECVKARSRPGTPPPISSSSTSSVPERKPMVVLPSYAQRPPSSPSGSSSSSASAMVQHLPLVDPTDSPPSSPPSPSHTLPFHSQPPALSLEDEDPSSETSQEFNDHGLQPQQQQSPSQRLTEPALWKCASLSRVEQSCLIWGVETVRGWIERERVRWTCGSGGASSSSNTGVEPSTRTSEREASPLPSPVQVQSPEASESQAITSPTVSTATVESSLDRGQHDAEEEDDSDVDGEYEIDEEYYESLPSSPMSPSFAPPPSPSTSSPTHLTSPSTVVTSHSVSTLPPTSPNCNSELENTFADSVVDSIPVSTLLAAPMSRTPSSSSMSNLSDVDGIEDEEWDDIDVPGITGPFELYRSGLADFEDEGEGSSDDRNEEVESDDDDDDEDDDDEFVEVNGEGEGCSAFQVFITSSASAEEDLKEVGGVEFAFRLDSLSPSHALSNRPLSPSSDFSTSSQYSSERDHAHDSDYDHDHDHDHDQERDGERAEGMEVGPDELPRLLGLPALCLREPGQDSLGLGTPAEAPSCAIGSFASGLATSGPSAGLEEDEAAVRGRKSAREEWMEVARRVEDEERVRTDLRNSGVRLGLGIGLSAFDERQILPQMDYSSPSTSSSMQAGVAGAGAVDCVMVDATTEGGLQLPTQMQMQLPASIDPINVIAPIEPLNTFTASVPYALDPAVAAGSLSLIPTDPSTLSPSIPQPTNVMSAPTSSSSCEMVPDNNNCNGFAWGMLGFNVGFGVGVHVGFGLASASASAQQQHQVQQTWTPVVESAGTQTFGTIEASSSGMGIGMGMGYVTPPPSATPGTENVDVVVSTTGTPIYHW